MCGILCELANAEVFFGLALFSVVFATLWRSSYQEWLTYKEIRNHGITIAADFNFAEKRSSGGEGPPDYIVNYSFVPDGAFRKITVSKIVDMTTFERYHNAIKVSIIYLDTDPEVSDIVENDIVIWKFWILGFMTLILTLCWLGAIISAASAQLASLAMATATALAGRLADIPNLM
jgi:hypothetical protein